jgi:hypothetical protein
MVNKWYWMWKMLQGQMLNIGGTTFMMIDGWMFMWLLCLVVEWSINNRNYNVNSFEVQLVGALGGIRLLSHFLLLILIFVWIDIVKWWGNLNQSCKNWLHFWTYIKRTRYHVTKWWLLEVKWNRLREVKRK